MGLPKEPRQKMINMMYLVLTALLALNVSSEILNAFKTVNTSIGKSNTVIDQKNSDTYKLLDSALNDPQTKAKAQIWKPKADKAKQLSASMATYIDALKLQLKKESGLEMIDGVEHFKEDNLDAATRLFDQLGKGKKLYDSLADYRKQMLDILDPSEFNADPVVKKDVENAKANFNKTLQVDMTVPPSQSGEKRAQDHKGWTTNYFHMTPTIAALTILSKFQNDVKNSEAAITDYCHQKIGQVKVVFDEFQALAQANSNYVMPGDDVEITAGVGAFSAAAKPKITIGGQLISVGNEGTAVWKGKAAGSGMKSIPVRIEFTKPDGTNAIVNREVKYEVGQPAGVAVSADKMNVFYIGVDNPVTITAGVGAEKIKASFSGGSIARSNGAHWIVKPTTPGEHNVNVIIEGKSTPIKFRVKYLPNPASFVGGSKGGSISAAQFKAMGGVIAKYEETDFEASFKVVSYTLAALGGSIPNYTEAQNDGNRWTGRAADIVNRAGPGSNIFLDKIIVVGPDGRRRELAPMVFNLR